MSARRWLETRSRARWLAGMRPAELRRACGISQRTIATALSVSRAAVHAWENGHNGPSGDPGAAYCRIIAGLARHAEVTW